MSIIGESGIYKVDYGASVKVTLLKRNDGSSLLSYGFTDSNNQKVLVGYEIPAKCVCKTKEGSLTISQMKTTIIPSVSIKTYNIELK